MKLIKPNTTIEISRHQRHTIRIKIINCINAKLQFGDNETIKKIC